MICRRCPKPELFWPQAIRKQKGSWETCGDLRLIDCETGGMQEVTFGKYRLRAYQQSVQNFRQRLREFCQGRGVRFFSVSSDTSLEQLLLNQLRQAEVWG